MSLPCMTTNEQNKEYTMPTCAQDDILNKLDSDKLKYVYQLKVALMKYLFTFFIICWMGWKIPSCKSIFSYHENVFCFVLGRCEHLLARNEQLRQQLEESHRTNLALTNDFHKLTIDWEHMRNEMAHKEDEWKEEEQVIPTAISIELNAPIQFSISIELYGFVFTGIQWLL